MSTENKKSASNDSRSLKEIFASMERARQEHPLASDEELQAKKQNSLQCLCEGEGSNHLYLKVTDQGRRVAVCPACNPRVHCQKCQGTGYYRHFNLSTLADDITPQGCECVQLEKRVEILAKANIPEKYLFADFSKYELSLLSETQVEKFMRCQELVYNFCELAHRYIDEGVDGQDKHFLVLMGPVGTGKTFLAVAALRRLILNYGHQGKFVDFQFLLAQLRDAYAKRASEDDLLRPLREAPILIIDEFGKGRTENEWQLEKLDDLVNSRYNSGKVTIVTTNYLTAELLKDWHKQMSEDERRLYLSSSGTSPSHPSSSYLTSESKTAPANESFWTQSLQERIGIRMYDRIVEAALFADFLGLPSLRKVAAQDFFRRYVNRKS